MASSLSLNSTTSTVDGYFEDSTGWVQSKWTLTSMTCLIISDTLGQFHYILEGPIIYRGSEDFEQKKSERQFKGNKLINYIPGYYTLCKMCNDKSIEEEHLTSVQIYLNDIKWEPPNGFKFGAIDQYQLNDHKIKLYNWYFDNNEQKCMDI